MGKGVTGRVGGPACGHPAREGLGWSDSPGGCSPGASCTAPSSPSPLSGTPSSLPAPTLSPVTCNLQEPRAPAGCGSKEGGAMSPAAGGETDHASGPHEDTGPEPGTMPASDFLSPAVPLEAGQKKNVLGGGGMGLLQRRVAL